MYAIKTADIVLFGGCNQLNVTHTQKATVQTHNNITQLTERVHVAATVDDGKELVWW